MNRKVIKPVVLSGLFLAALIVFSIITNQDNKDMTTAMKEATLPIVQFYEGNNSVAQLHGYVSEMNITKMRDGIVPVDHTRLLPLKINTYGQKIRGIAYEIRSLDDSRLVAKGNAQEIKAMPLIFCPYVLIFSGSSRVWSTGTIPSRIFVIFISDTYPCSCATLLFPS